MNEQEIKQALDALGEKTERIFVSVEKTRKYFLAVLVISVIAFVLPLFGLLFAIPSFLSSYGSLLNQ